MGGIIYTWCFYFFIYAFVGWCAEVAYAAVVLGRFVNRGFLNGPVCPIYGFSVCFVVLCLLPLRSMPVLTYIGAVLLTSLLEFITGWLLERFFNQKWWDYSNIRFNIKGYVCLRFSLLWGCGCLAVIYLAHPLVATLVAWLPKVIGLVLISVFGVLFVLDFAGSLAGVLRVKKLLALFGEMDERLHKVSDFIGENISDTVLSAVESGKKGEEKFLALRDKYGETLREHGMGDFSELKVRYETIMKRGAGGTAKRLLSAFPKLRNNERIRSASERIDRLLSSVKKNDGSKTSGTVKEGTEETDIRGNKK